MSTPCPHLSMMERAAGYRCIECESQRERTLNRLVAAGKLSPEEREVLFDPNLLASLWTNRARKARRHARVERLKGFGRWIAPWAATAVGVTCFILIIFFINQLTNAQGASS